MMPNERDGNPGRSTRFFEEGGMRKRWKLPAQNTDDRDASSTDFAEARTGA